MTEGVDYSYDRPDAGELAAAGKRFAVRYVGTPSSGKSLTDGEAQQLISAGIAVVATYETSPGFMASGTGELAASRARAHARTCGMPDDRPIYFALDVDPGGLTSLQRLAVERFLDAAAGVIGRDAVGVYGGFEAIEWLVPRFARWGWQTYAWSAGRWSTKAHLQQYRNGVALAGGTVDLCRSITTDFGQWGLDHLEDDMPLNATDLANVEKTIENTVRRVLNEGTGRGQTTWAGTSAATLATSQAAINLLNAIRGALGNLDIDESELAIALAPLLVSQTRSLSDADLEAIAKAVNDEQHRRSAS